MADKENTVFDTLNAIDVNGHTEKKNTGGKELTYLSWCWAWAEVKKKYPDATYEVVKFDGGIPYSYDPRTGYMVYTRVTIQGLTHEMWLPVMDGQNKAMKSEPYDFTTKSGPKHVEAATMTDINKAIMRCLVKNLAMFGLGLYIYAGEDLPENPVYEFECSECGKIFNNVQYAQATLDKFKRYICKECCDKKVAEEKAKAEAKKKAEAEAQAKAKEEAEAKADEYQPSEDELKDLPFEF